MSKHSRFIVAFCLVTVALLASGCGMVTVVPSPTVPSIPSRTPVPALPQITVPTLTKTSEPVWSVLFKYDFGENYWKAGQHSYRIIVVCPDTEYFDNIDEGLTFTVNEQAMLWPSDAIIEFRESGIIVLWDGLSAYPGKFHPQQKTRIAFWLWRLSIEQAKQAIEECQVSAILDEETKLKLLPEYPIIRPFLSE